jgi:hypothetical protein
MAVVESVAGWTTNAPLGLVVPMPTLPLESTVIKVEVAVPAVEEPIANKVEAACEA